MSARVHDWYQFTCSDSTLIPRLDDLEAEGFEIFAITNLAGSEFVRVVYRKRRS